MLELRNISFSYKNKPVFTDLSMELKDGEILAVMGPSGCGKTTLLSLIAGVLRPQTGHILSDIKQISYVFQEPRLLPWCTVEENLAVVLAHPREERDRMTAVLASMGLSEAASLYPRALSGGMKSRVALARAMLYGGDLYLLDEPFAALDAQMRLSLAAVVREHLLQTGASAILVTHQEDVAAAMADRILHL